MPYAKARYLVTFLHEASELLHRVHENPQLLMTSIEALPHNECHVPCQSALVRFLADPFSSSSQGVVGHLIRWGEPLLWRIRPVKYILQGSIDDPKLWVKNHNP